MSKLAQAIRAFRQECPTFIKDTDGYGYKYTTLDQIEQVIQPLLKKHKLSYLQRNSFNTETECISVHTTIYLDGSDETLESNIGSKVYDLAKMNKYQAMGSAITYFRRYDLSTALGIMSEKDTDGAGKVATPSMQKTIYKAKQVIAPTLTPKHDKWPSIVQYIKDGGDIDKIKARFLISKSAETQLKKEAEGS